MESVKLEVKYGERASRLELIIRLLYGIPLGIVLLILSLLGGIAFFLQWLVILVTGKRNSTLHRLLQLSIDYYATSKAYTGLLTEERPPIIPEF